MKPDLLGYALDALEPEEHRVVEEHLAASAEARAELAALQAGLGPLACDAEGLAPPPHLFAETLKRVAAHRCRRVPAPMLPPSRGGGRLAWRQVDVLVAAGIILVLFMLTAPALLYARHRQAITACAENLHRFHTAFALYSQQQEPSGYLPRPEKQGPFSAAGVYAVALRDAGVWNSGLQATCPANRSSRPAIAPPTREELRAQCQGCGLAKLQAVYETLGGCYAYNLGYEDETGKFMAIGRDLGEHVPIMADRPQRSRETPEWERRNSPNHNGVGQNVLYLGGHVRFQRARVLGTDDIYLNVGGRLAVGRGPHDAVLGPGEAQPYPPDQE